MKDERWEQKHIRPISKAKDSFLWIENYCEGGPDVGFHRQKLQRKYYKYVQRIENMIITNKLEILINKSY